MEMPLRLREGGHNPLALSPVREISQLRMYHLERYPPKPETRIPSEFHRLNLADTQFIMPSAPFWSGRLFFCFQTCRKESMKMMQNSIFLNKAKGTIIIIQFQFDKIT